MAGSTLPFRSLMTLISLNIAAVFALRSSHSWTHSRAPWQAGLSLCVLLLARRRLGPFPRVTAPPPASSAAGRSAPARCRCQRPLDVLGDHVAACPRARRGVRPGLSDASDRMGLYTVILILSFLHCGRESQANTKPWVAGCSACSPNHTRSSDWISCRPSVATPASFQRAVLILATWRRSRAWCARRRTRCSAYLMRPASRTRTSMLMSGTRTFRTTCAHALLQTNSMLQQKSPGSKEVGRGTSLASGVTELVPASAAGARARSTRHGEP